MVLGTIVEATPRPSLSELQFGGALPRHHRIGLPASIRGHHRDRRTALSTPPSKNGGHRAGSRFLVNDRAHRRQCCFSRRRSEHRIGLMRPGGRRELVRRTVLSTPRPKKANTESNLAFSCTAEHIVAIASLVAAAAVVAPSTPASAPLPTPCHARTSPVQPDSRAWGMARIHPSGADALYRLLSSPMSTSTSIPDMPPPTPFGFRRILPPHADADGPSPMPPASVFGVLSATGARLFCVAAADGQLHRLFASVIAADAGLSHATHGYRAPTRRAYVSSRHTSGLRRRKPTPTTPPTPQLARSAPATTPRPYSAMTARTTARPCVPLHDRPNFL